MYTIAEEKGGEPHLSEITAVTITYNRPELLGRTIESVLNQTFTDFEYIIINNGSTDCQTASIIDTYIKKDSRVFSYAYQNNIIYTDQCWFAKQLHQGRIGSCDSQYFFIIDDDDFMERDTLETLYCMAKTFKSDIVGIGSQFVYPDGSKKDKYTFNETYTFNRVDGMCELLKRRYFNSARGGKLYRKDVLQFDIVPGVRNRDIYREYRVMNNINSITVCGKPKYYFYRHDSNLSGLDNAVTITPEKMREHLSANRIRTKWLSERMPEIKEFAYYCEASFMISLWDRIHTLEVTSCYPIAAEMKQYLQESRKILSSGTYLTEKERAILARM